MGTRQALVRFHLYGRNLEQLAERFIISVSKFLHQLGGYVLDVMVVLQVVAAAIVVFTGDVPPLRNAAYQFQSHLWRYVAQEQAFALLLLSALITGVWGIGQRKIPTRAMQAALRFGAWFIKIGAPIR